MIWCIQTYIIAYVKIRKNEDILSSMSNLQPNWCLKIDFQKVGQHAGGKWLFHDTKRRRDNQLQSLKLPCRHGLVRTNIFTKQQRHFNDERYYFQTYLTVFIQYTTKHSTFLHIHIYIYILTTLTMVFAQSDAWYESQFSVLSAIRQTTCKPIRGICINDVYGLLKMFICDIWYQHGPNFEFYNLNWYYSTWFQKQCNLSGLALLRCEKLFGPTATTKWKAVK